MALKPYPKVVCWKCAHPFSKVNDMGAITMHTDWCDVCGEYVGVSTPGDYGWPDFPGFVKVKRSYHWD
jgi:rRNA maturation protein Nop10